MSSDDFDDDKPVESDADVPIALNQEDQEGSDKQTLGALHIMTSVLAAAVGVQSKKNQTKDFNSQSSIYIYITAGIVFTAIFVFAVYWVVQAVLENAGM